MESAVLNDVVSIFHALSPHRMKYKLLPGEALLLMILACGQTLQLRDMLEPRLVIKLVQTMRRTQEEDNDDAKRVRKIS